MAAKHQNVSSCFSQRMKFENMETAQLNFMGTNVIQERSTIFKQAQQLATKIHCTPELAKIRMVVHVCLEIKRKKV